MCGIIGIIGQHNVVPELLTSLDQLAYRGYDSAGIGALCDGKIERRRARGKIANLIACLTDHPLQSSIGIGHTRWATHGAPSEANAHPHATEQVAVVHNGIIENYRDLRSYVTAYGCCVETDTDTEVIAHLLTIELEINPDPISAMSRLLERLEGTFALACLIANEPDLMLGARRGSPLVVGRGENGVYLGSDALTLASQADGLIFLEDGDWVEMHPTMITIRDARGHPVRRKPKPITAAQGPAGKGHYRYFMHKEIFEQPAMLSTTFNSLVSAYERKICPLGPDLARARRLVLLACGTAYHACLVGRYWIESMSGLTAMADIASEFRYRHPSLHSDDLVVAVSQSGETADTLAALRYCREAGLASLAIVNVPESGLAREADHVIFTQAGPEIGVASTKAFTTQLMVLSVLALALGEAHQSLSPEQVTDYLGTLATAPELANHILTQEEQLIALAALLAQARDVLYLGRGLGYPIALEGALKLKEISYIHAEGQAAGELKHGLIALIDDAVPVVALAPPGPLFSKMASNIEQVAARGGQVILIADQAGCDQLSPLTRACFVMPPCHPWLAPILYSLPLQLLAYHAAILRGTDVDQPRNLAKSVTVE